MLNTRYEEYTSGVPFRLSVGLERTAARRSDAANWHDALELQCCTRGEGFVLLDGERFPLRAGELAVANAGAIHYTGTQTALVYSCLILDADFCRGVGLDPERLDFQPHFRDPQLLGLFRRLETAWTDADPCRTARLQALVLEILMALYTRHLRGERAGSEPGPVRTAIRYIRTHLDQRITLDELARQTYVDKYRLSRDFKSATGQTVVAYINACRCRQVMTRMAGGENVSTAAMACGFRNMSFFARVFREYTGMTPSEYRKKL